MSKEDVEKVTQSLRGLASKLNSFAYTMPGYNFWLFLGITRVKREDLIEAATKLVGYSNLVRADHKEHDRSFEQEKLKNDYQIF